MIQQRVQDKLFNDNLVPPSFKQRYWVTAAVLAALGFFVGYALILFICWRNLPWAPLDMGSIQARTILYHQIGSLVNAVIPILFSGEAEVLASFEASYGSAAKKAMDLRVALATLGGLGLGGFLFSLGIKPKDSTIQTRGRMLVDGKSAIAEVNGECKSEIARSAADLMIHPKVRFSTDRYTKHLLIMGAVGGGKTTIILPLLQQIIEADDRAVIFDIKGDFTAKFKKPILFAPWDARGAVWDIARDCTTRQDARTLAEQLVEGSKDPMWSNASRQLLVGFLVKLQQERGTDWGWQDLADCLSVPEDELVDIMQEYNPEALRSVEQSGQTTTGILINLTAFLSIVFDLADAWGNAPANRKFSFARWLFDEKTKRKQIILQGNGRFPALMRGYVSSIVSLLSSRINSPQFSDSKTRKIWFVLDEFPQMGKVDIEPMIAVGRSKGVRVVIGCQDLNQIKKIYSEEEAKSWMAMMGTQIFAKVSAGDTAKWVSELVGKREVERPNISVASQAGGNSSTFMYAREEVDVVTPDQLTSELGAFPTGVRCLLLGFKNALLLEWPYQDLPNERDSYREAAWVSGEKASGGAAGDGTMGLREFEESEFEMDERLIAERLAAQAREEAVRKAEEERKSEEERGAMEGDSGEQARTAEGIDAATRRQAAEANRKELEAHKAELAAEMAAGAKEAPSEERAEPAPSPSPKVRPRELDGEDFAAAAKIGHAAGDSAARAAGAPNHAEAAANAGSKLALAATAAEAVGEVRAELNRGPRLTRPSDF